MKPFWMLSILVIVIIVISGAGCITTQNASTNQTIDGITIPTTTGSPTPAEARQIAAAAYVFGYPLVWTDVYKDHQTAVPAPNATLGVAPVNQLARPYQAQLTSGSLSAQSLPYATYDWAYAQGWLNLTKEPMVLSVPASNGRYYVIAMYDAWQNVFASLGSRTTGNESGAFALVGPGWNGTLPANVTKIQAPTNTMLLVGRAQNGPTDLPTAAAFQDNVTVTPVSTWGTHYTPPTTVPGNPNVNLTYVRAPAAFAEVANMTPDVFYGRMATVMGGNPPSSADKPVADQMARIGIVPGTPFNWNGLNATMQNAITQGFQDGISQVAASINAGIVHNNGWDTTYVAGAYGTNYTFRDAVILRGSFANLPQDNLYFTSNATATGVPYSGANNYVLHFANNSTPPVNALWSLTMYDTQGYPVPNPLNRSTIAPHLGNLTYNPDGSLDIYIQHASPGPNKESNWLPAPSGPFEIWLRTYWPQESLLNGSWVPPAVQMVAGSG